MRIQIARLNSDFTSGWVRDDLRRWGVHTNYLTTIPSGPVPVIIEWIYENEQGKRLHRYSFTCPTCGSRKPSYKPVHTAAIKKILLQMPPTDVFFFDRLSRSALLLAQHCRERGALIIFEPSGVGDRALLTKALSLSHVLKYSHDRLGGQIDARMTKELLLEMETFGQEGIRFRSSLPRATTGWKQIDAYPVELLKDAAGAGDWFTAVLIHQLGRRGLRGFVATARRRLLTALSLAQAAAAWNCGFEGPRSGMYTTTATSFWRAVQSTVAGEGKVAGTGVGSAATRRLVAINGACLQCQATHAVVGAPSRSR
jgi:fructokinase